MRRIGGSAASPNGSVQSGTPPASIIRSDTRTRTVPLADGSRRAVLRGDVSHGRAGHTRARAGWGQRGVPPLDRSAPRRASGALLPHPRLDARRRGRGAGDAAGGVAWPEGVRGALLVARVALPDRHEY